MTAKDKQKIAINDRKLTVNISIPVRLLFAIDENCEIGKRSEYITDILMKDETLLKSLSKSN